MRKWLVNLYIAYAILKPILKWYFKLLKSLILLVFKGVRIFINTLKG